MSAWRHHGEVYKHLRQPPPTPPKATKPQLKKTISLPQGVLLPYPPSAPGGGGGGGGGPGRRNGRLPSEGSNASETQRDIDIGGDLLGNGVSTHAPLVMHAGTVAHTGTQGTNGHTGLKTGMGAVRVPPVAMEVPEATLIDLGSSSDDNTPPLLPPTRSMSASAPSSPRPRPRPRLTHQQQQQQKAEQQIQRRPPPPPPFPSQLPGPAHDSQLPPRRSTLPAAALLPSRMRKVPPKIPPVPPPKPAGLWGASQGKQDVTEKQAEEEKDEEEKENSSSLDKREKRDEDETVVPVPRTRVPSPYLLFKPLDGKFPETQKADSPKPDSTKLDSPKPWAKNPVRPTLTSNSSTISSSSAPPSPSSPAPKHLTSSFPSSYSTNTPKPLPSSTPPSFTPPSSSAPPSSSSSLPPTSSSAPPPPSLTAPKPRPRPIAYANPRTREMEYTEREHPKIIFDYLNKMREKGHLCDVTLMADEREIKAHRAILAACSQYFESMFIGEFSEPEGEPIIMEEVEADALQALIDFAYTSRIHLTDHNIYFVFAAADLLQFTGVRAACFKFFKQQMNKSNCIRTWLFADSHNCTELLDAATKYIECNFLDIVRGREFLTLDQPNLVGQILALEDLAITSEEQVFEAALAWLRYDEEKRAEVAEEVMKSVRFLSMSRDYLLHCADSEPLIKENAECLQLLIEALETHVSGNHSKLRKMLLKQNNSPPYTNVNPRAASMAVEMLQFKRENQALGMRIMGGWDRPHHVFRQGDQPGIFVLMMTPEGAAAKTGKLKAGDRILKVNGEDMTHITHEQAIRVLKTSSDPLTVMVRHEPPPQGLQELTLVTKPGEGFGLSICGGVNGYHGNPFDETDEGIFITQIIPGGAAESDGRLKEGMRILQVNSVSMLGKTQDEALHVLHGVLDRINLLVCSGYDPLQILCPQEEVVEVVEVEEERSGVVV